MVAKSPYIEGLLLILLIIAFAGMIMGVLKMGVLKMRVLIMQVLIMRVLKMRVLKMGVCKMRVLKMGVCKMGVLFILLSLLLVVIILIYTCDYLNLITCRTHAGVLVLCMTLHVYNMEEMHEGFHLNCTIKATKTHSIQNNL